MKIIASKFDYIPEDVKKKALNESNTASGKSSAPKDEKPPEKKATGKEKKQHRLIKYKRAGVVLSEDTVKEIKAGRKKLRKEMRARGIKSKDEFEMTAGSMGLYFDKKRSPLIRFFLRHWFGSLLALLALLFLITFIFAAVQYMRGHFTINLSEGMFKRGFTLSETYDFKNPSTHLFASVATDVPCISVNQIPEDIDSIDGEHNDKYFAYTSYIRNDGEDKVSFRWTLALNSETQNTSEGVWALVFVDGKMNVYAKVNKETGEAEAMPPLSDNRHGYINLDILSLSHDVEQFHVVADVNGNKYYRIIPKPYKSDMVIDSDIVYDVSPHEIHKFTVVLWIEGDDPDSVDELVGGSLGVELQYDVYNENEEIESDIGKNKQGEGNAISQFLEDLFANLKFW